MVVPLTMKQANAYIKEHHRHHKPVHAHRFSIGAIHSEQLVGCAVIARPAARLVDPYKVAEVARLATDGTKNACSFLYSASARIAREMGFEKIQTYILDSESGTSLIAAGWNCEARECGGGDWNRASRGYRNRTDQPMQKKQRWSKELR